MMGATHDEVTEGLSRGGVLWLTGLPCSGKTTLGQALVSRLGSLGERGLLLDGDELRQGVSADLGFSPQDRSAHAARVAFVAACVERVHGWAVVGLISPYRATRQSARDRCKRFCLVHVATPLSVCESRDSKGHYALARSGALASFTGVDAPYEEPYNPELVIGRGGQSVDDGVDEVMAWLRRQQWLR